MRFLGIDTSPLNGNEELCLTAGFSWLFLDFAFISEKPLAIRRNTKGQLHKDEGLALEHSDGWGVYALNGVRMTPEQVLTPAEAICPESVLKETNTDRRRELIRKVGMERMLAQLPRKSLHRRGNYELLSVDLPQISNDVRYLKMLNPSVGCWHLEAIDKNECAEKTVEAALNWRNSSKFVDAEILT